jgi:hypothetical protein
MGKPYPHCTSDFRIPTKNDNHSNMVPQEEGSIMKDDHGEEHKHGNERVTRFLLLANFWQI